MHIHPPPPQLRCFYSTETQNPQFVQSTMRFRKRILVDLHGWDLQVSDGLERDEFDTGHAVHGAVVDGGEIRGSFRLIRSDRPYLAAEKFGFLARDRTYPRSQQIWELSRLAVSEDIRAFEMLLRTYSAIFHFARMHGAVSLVAFADIAMERLCTRIGITSERYGPPVEIGHDRSGRPITCVAGEMPLRLQKGPRFEKLLSYCDNMEIDDATAILGRNRVPA